MNQKTITIDILCACGTKCGELTVRADHWAGTDLKKHGIEKVECDICKSAREKGEAQAKN